MTHSIVNSILVGRCCTWSTGIRCSSTQLGALSSIVFVTYPVLTRTFGGLLHSVINCLLTMCRVLRIIQPVLRCCLIFEHFARCKCIIFLLMCAKLNISLFTFWNSARSIRSILRFNTYRASYSQFYNHYRCKTRYPINTIATSVAK